MSNWYSALKQKFWECDLIGVFQGETVLDVTQALNMMHIKNWSVTGQSLSQPLRVLAEFLGRLKCSEL